MYLLLLPKRFYSCPSCATYHAYFVKVFFFRVHTVRTRDRKVVKIIEWAVSNKQGNLNWVHVARPSQPLVCRRQRFGTVKGRSP